MRVLLRFFQKTFAMLLVLLYNKDNLGGFPMRKRKSRADLALTIVTGVFFAAAAALYFLLPTIDASVGVSPLGAPYDPIALFVEGAKAFINFEYLTSMNLAYLLVFGTGCFLAIFLILWLVAIIVKKKPIKLIYWFIFVIMCAGCAIVTLAYTLVVCRSVTLTSGSVLDQHIFLDMIFYYELAGYTVSAGGVEFAPVIFVNFMSVILAWAMLSCIGLVAFFSFLSPLICSIKLFRGDRVKAKKEKPAPAPVVEEVEEEEEEDDELARRRARLISYVEYKSGIPAREKEYEEICRANGIPLPGDLDAEADEAYYEELSRTLPILQIQEPVEDNSEEEYYDELARSLPVLHETAPEVDPEQAYYDELARTLPVLNQPAPEVDAEQAYYDELKATLPALQPQEPEPVPEVDKDEEYYKKLEKDLAFFKLARASQYVNLEKYYRDTIAELDMFKPADPDKDAEAISNLRRSVARKRAYYQHLIESLPCLQYQKDPVEPEFGDETK